MSSNALVESEVMSEVCLDEIKIAKGLLTKGKVSECLALLEDIEDMMFVVLAMAKKSGDALH